MFKTAGATDRNTYCSRKHKIDNRRSPNSKMSYRQSASRARLYPRRPGGRWAEKKSKSDQRGGQRPERREGPHSHPIKHARHPRMTPIGSGQQALWTLQCKSVQEAEEMQRADPEWKRDSGRIQTPQAAISRGAAATRTEAGTLTSRCTSRENWGTSRAPCYCT